MPLLNLLQTPVLVLCNIYAAMQRAKISAFESRKNRIFNEKGKITQ